jgi:hypothetical protein
MCKNQIIDTRAEEIANGLAGIVLGGSQRMHMGSGSQREAERIDNGLAGIAYFSAGQPERSCSCCC